MLLKINSGIAVWKPMSLMCRLFGVHYSSSSIFVLYIAPIVDVILLSLVILQELGV